MESTETFPMPERRLEQIDFPGNVVSAGEYTIENTDYEVCGRVSITQKFELDDKPPEFAVTLITLSGKNDTFMVTGDDTGSFHDLLEISYAMLEETN